MSGAVGCWQIFTYVDCDVDDSLDKFEPLKNPLLPEQLVLLADDDVEADEVDDAGIVVFVMVWFGWKTLRPIEDGQEMLGGCALFEEVDGEEIIVKSAKSYWRINFQIRSILLLVVNG